MTTSLQIGARRRIKTITFRWQYGALPARLLVGVSIAAVLVLASALWVGTRIHKEADRLSVRATKLQTIRDASAAAVQAAEPPDLVQTLPTAPLVAQVMQTLQQAADKEGAQVMSLQAEDHAPTTTTLGHLDLVLSIRAPYPSILVVIQQVLDRYPGATLRQLNLAHTVAPASTMPVITAPSNGPSALPPMTESEAFVTLAFWRRPLGAQAVFPVDAVAPASVAAPSNAQATTDAAPRASMAARSPGSLPAVVVHAASGPK